MGINKVVGGDRVFTSIYYFLSVSEQISPKLVVHIWSNQEVDLGISRIPVELLFLKSLHGIANCKT